MVVHALNRLYCVQQSRKHHGPSPLISSPRTTPIFSTKSVSLPPASHLARCIIILVTLAQDQSRWRFEVALSLLLLSREGVQQRRLQIRRQGHRHRHRRRNHGCIGRPCFAACSVRLPSSYGFFFLKVPAIAGF